MEKHFELTDETIEVAGNTMHRIRCTRDCKWAKTGDLGGFIEKEDNLSGNAWVSDNARVYGNAWVSDNARVYGDARVYGNARLAGDARVSGNARLAGKARVAGNARLYGNAWVYGNSRVYGNAWVSDNAQVYGKAWVSDNARVYGDARVYGNARLAGDARVSGNARLAGKARVAGNDDHCGFDVFGSIGRHTHAYRTSDGGVEITCGCFHGDIEAFEAKVRHTHGDSQYAREYLAIAHVIRVKFGLA